MNTSLLLQAGIFLWGLSDDDSALLPYELFARQFLSRTNGMQADQ
jgi:hypothetical protein